MAQDTPFVRRGGPPALDLINTEIIVRGRPADLLADDAAVAAWFAFERDQLELEAVRLPRLDELAVLRAALRRVFSAVAVGQVPAPHDLDALNRAAGREPVSLAIEWGEAPRLRASPRSERHSPDGIAAVARSALAFLVSPDRGCLRTCGNPSCVLIFVQSNRRQQWCSEACGRRVRTARFEQRHTAQR